MFKLGRSGLTLARLTLAWLTRTLARLTLARLILAQPGQKSEDSSMTAAHIYQMIGLPPESRHN